jgi:hypothetical protein
MENLFDFADENCFYCPKCQTKKPKSQFVAEPDQKYQLIAVCNQCADEFFIEKVDCTCSVCKRKLPSNYFQHYRTRFKKNGLRLRVNTNCKDCSKTESSYVNKLKKIHPAPAYNTKCPQCEKIVYEKVEDIPDGVNGTNGPWQCDHDHITKEFRRYLCKRCNTGTGLIGDSQLAWEKAVPFKKNR